MKAVTFYSFVFIFLFTFSNGMNAASKEKKAVTELYYKVKDGVVNKKSVVERRKLVYDQNRNFISGHSDVKGTVTPLSSDDRPYCIFPLLKEYIQSCTQDTESRTITFKQENTLSGTRIHTVRYNEWGDVTEHRIRAESDPEQQTVLTYEYFYPNEFTYVEKDGIYFISGLKNNYSSLWVACTTRKNDQIVQYTERKITHK